MPVTGIAVSREKRFARPQEAQLWLLLVGVNEYRDSAIPNLRFCAADCRGLAEVLTESTRNFASRHSYVHHDAALQAPTIANVRESLDAIVRQAQPQDTVLFYFCGHGTLDLPGRQAILCLSDTRKEDLIATGLPLNTLLAQLADCQAERKLVWLDACHSGGLSLSRTEAYVPQALLDPTGRLFESLRESAAQSKGFYAMLSCDQSQLSWEFPALGHGLFTHFLIRGLGGGAANPRGTITVDDLYLYVYHQTLRYIDDTNRQRRLINEQICLGGGNDFLSEYPQQTPKRIFEGIGEQVIAIKPATDRDLPQRRAFVFDSSEEGSILSLSRVLGGTGSFRLDYWLPRRGTPAQVRQGISTCLQSNQVSGGEQSADTALVYLRGTLDEDADEGPELLLGNGTRIRLYWLRHQLQISRATQHILILDCPGSAERLAAWVADLALGPDRGQCLIAGASPGEEPDRFARALVRLLETVDEGKGLTAAGLIGRLQVQLAAPERVLFTRLAGGQGVIDLLPQHHGPTNADWALDMHLCPYMGLRAFGVEDASFFFGRDELTAEILTALAESTEGGFLAVVGASGSGKSSVVQAGVLAQLRLGRQIPGSERWWTGSFRPGSQPVEALCRALVVGSADPEQEFARLEGLTYLGVEGFVQWLRSYSEPMLVLVADQFEELFTLAPTSERERFLALVLGAIERAGDRFKLIATVRADFVGACLEVAALAPHFKDNSILVPPLLSEEDYRQVITEPARRVSLQVDPELVEALLQELNHSAGDLPLLEFVLEQLWELRVPGEGRITLSAYRQQIGGLKGALEKKAQQTYESLDAEAQACAQWIFLSLTQLGEGTEDTRRRVRKSELKVARYQTALIDRTLKTLTDSKLVVMDLEGEVAAGRSRTAAVEEVSLLERMQREVTVEVAHEVLIRYWSTLRWWLDENRSRLRTEREIAQAATLWRRGNEQPDFLLRGVRLAEAEDIYTDHSDELSQDVQRFIDACLEERRQQQRRDQRQLRQAQIAAGVMSVLGAVAIGFGAIAYLKVQEVQRSQIRALNASAEGYLFRNQQLEAMTASVKARQLLKNTLGIDDELRIETDSTLRQMLFEVQEQNRLDGHGDKISNLTYSPNGKLIASASTDRTIRLWKADGTPVRTLSGHSDQARGVAFSPDGRILASASRDRTIRLWRVSDGALLLTLHGHSNIIYNVAFSPDGSILASASRDKTVRLWRVSDGVPIAVLRGHRDLVFSIGFSPDGKTLASTGWDSTVRLWRVSDGALLRTLADYKDQYYTVVFHPKGHILAAAGRSGNIDLWDVASGRPLRPPIKAHTDDINALRFDPSGKILASASDDSTVRLWTIDGTLQTTFKSLGDGIDTIGFSPDGSSLAAGGTSNVIQIWKLNERRRQTLMGHQSGVRSVSFSPNGKLIASADMDGTVRVWGADGTALATLLPSGNFAVRSTAFSPDGKYLSAGSESGSLVLWNTSTFTVAKRFENPQQGTVTGIAFDPDGRTVATSTADMTVNLWDIETGKLRRTLHGDSGYLNAVAIAPDGSLLAAAGRDGTVVVWKMSTGAVVKTIQAHKGTAMDVKFTPDGRTIVTAGADGVVRVWHLGDYRLLATLPHGSFLSAISISSDGSLVASGGTNKMIKIWNLAEGRLEAVLKGHGAAVYSLAFKPESRVLASAGGDKQVIVWQWGTNSSQLVQQGCNWLASYLRTNQNTQKEDRQLCRD